MTCAGLIRDPFARRENGCRGRLVRWEGHELIELENAQLLVRVSLTRGAEILELRDRRTDRDILWHGHDDVVRNRGGVPSVNLKDGNFLDHFSGGWQEVLPSAQFPSSLHGAAQGVHGEAALLPWDWKLVADDAGQVCVELSVRLRRYPLTLMRRMTLERDTATLTITEELVNESAVVLAVAWGHHLCLGGRMADPGTRLHLPEGTRLIVPDSLTASTGFRPGESSWPHVAAADDGRTDLRRLPDSNGTDGTVIAGPMTQGHAAVDNPVVDLRIDLTWDAELFPYCWSWMVWEGHHEWPLWGRERFITLEPFTSPLIPLDQAADLGATLLMEPHGKVDTELQLALGPSQEVTRSTS